MPAADLRTFDHERAALVQLCVHLEQKLLFLEKLQVQNVARFGLSPRIDMQCEIFTGSKPVFLTGFKGFARLADDLKLIVAEKLFQRFFDARQFGETFSAMTRPLQTVSAAFIESTALIASASEAATKKAQFRMNHYFAA